MPHYVFFPNSKTRYQSLHQHCHLIENKSRESNKCFKVKPLLQAVRTNCNKTEVEDSHSIDQQTIPKKTKSCGGICQ